MNFDDYKVKMVRPSKPVKPSLFVHGTSDQFAVYAVDLKLYEEQMDDFDFMIEEIGNERSRLETKFKADALEEVGLTGHPKADKIFGCAWERGHSYGLHEVFCELETLAELFEVD